MSQKVSRLTIVSRKAKKVQSKHEKRNHYYESITQVNVFKIIMTSCTIVSEIFHHVTTFKFTSQAYMFLSLLASTP